jgi:hypothetical protein
MLSLKGGRPQIVISKALAFGVFVKLNVVDRTKAVVSAARRGYTSL